MQKTNLPTLVEQSLNFLNIVKFFQRRYIKSWKHPAKYEGSFSKEGTLNGK